MRHFLLPRAIALSARSVLETTAGARLIMLSGRALPAAPDYLRAAFRTIDVAAIATGADEHLRAAARAQKQARDCISLFGFVTQTWTKRATGEILPRHSCPTRVCGARR